MSEGNATVGARTTRPIPVLFLTATPSRCLDEEEISAIVVALNERDRIIYSMLRSSFGFGETFYLNATQIAECCDLELSKTRASMNRLFQYGLIELVIVGPRPKGGVPRRLVPLTRDHEFVCRVSGGRIRSGKNMPRPGRTALYRWRDFGGRLLYIGITNDVNTRQTEHAKTSAWSGFAATATVTWYPTRTAAERAERHAIETEKPLFNRTYSDLAARREALVEYLTEQDRLDLLTTVGAA